MLLESTASVLALDQDYDVSGRTPSNAIASAASSVSIAAMTASMSATSIRTPTRVGFSGSTKVRMFVTPSGPKTSSRFGDASQCSLSLTSWYANTVGMQLLSVVADPSGRNYLT